MVIEGNWETREVLIDGIRLDPARSQEVWNHSPDGFNWSYGGSGPAQLALAILLEAGVSVPLATLMHQRFKAAFIAGLPRGPFRIEVDVLKWVEENTGTHVTVSEAGDSER